jgi:AraC family transcriptional regulator
LQRIADASGLSKMHFAALFRASTGMSPSGFVVQRRIERAQAELLCTSKPVVDVALSLGFQTQAHFSTVFKRLIGEAPSEWRRRHTNLEPEHVPGWLEEDQSSVVAPSPSTSFSSSS